MNRSESTARTADRIVVSYPSDLSTWGRFQVENSPFRAYLRKTLGEVEPGDGWEEFVGVGCCGNTLDVPLRIEHVDGGPLVDGQTTIEYDVREACDIDGGWKVQSEAGPNAAPEE